MQRIRRTRFYLSSNEPSRILEGLKSDADAIVFDLEDLIPYAEKDAARIMVTYAVSECDFGRKEIMVRVNNLETGLTQSDVEVLGDRPITLLYPKTETKEELEEFDRLLSETERKKGIPVGQTKVIPAIETAKGLLNCREIAKGTRVDALSIGLADFRKDIQATATPQMTEVLFARSYLIACAREAGLQVLDSVYPQVDDLEGFADDFRHCMSLGFDGKGVVSIVQTEVAHKIIQPSEEEVSQSEKVLAAVVEAEASGRAIPILNGRMLDSAAVFKAKKVLALNEVYKH